MKSVKRPKKIRRRHPSILVLMPLLALGGLALIAARPVDKKPAVASPPSSEEVILPVPARNVARGERLADVPMTTTRWPKTRLVEGYVTDLARLKEGFAATPLPLLLPIPSAALTSAAGSDGNAVVQAIPEGMRAITVKVDAESAVEGWARAGNTVDVILVRSSKESGAGLESLVIAENVRILSAGSTTAASGSETAAKAPNTVTLLVTQEDALRVKTAANIGKLTFALRGQSDDLPATTKIVNQQKLFGSPSTPAPSFKGKATGPDGKVYLLEKDATWIRSLENNPR